MRTSGQGFDYVVWDSLPGDSGGSSDAEQMPKVEFGGYAGFG